MIQLCKLVFLSFPLTNLDINLIRLWFSLPKKKIHINVFPYRDILNIVLEVSLHGDICVCAWMSVYVYLCALSIL